MPDFAMRGRILGVKKGAPGRMGKRKSPAPVVRGLKRIDRANVRSRPVVSGYIWVMSRSLVSGRNISPTTKLIAATMIGYQRPE